MTGGGTGLGYQIATGLAEAGAEVALCGRNVERCRAAATDIEPSARVRAVGLRCDVRDVAEMHGVVEGALCQLGRVDILVNKAGTSWGCTGRWSFRSRDGGRSSTSNLTGVFLFTQAVGRHLIGGGRGGNIINLSWVTAFRGAPEVLLDAVAYTTHWSTSRWRRISGFP